MRTATSTLIAATLLLQAVTAFAEEVPVDPTMEKTMEEDTMTIEPPQTEEEIMDETCREKLKISEGQITQGYLLHSYRACLRLIRQDVKAKKDAEILLQKTSIGNARAKTVTDRIKSGSKRLIQNQGNVRHQLNAKQKLKAGKKTFVRFRRRSIFRVPAAGTGSTKP